MDHADVTRLSCRAYAKVILHAAKYPHCAINGVLLARSLAKDRRNVEVLSSEGQQDQSSRSGQCLEIVDAVPLFHQIQGLAPLLEVALAQIESVAAGVGLTLAGYYHANENFDDVSVDAFSQKVADKIAENSTLPSTVLATLDNRRLGLSMETHAIASISQFVEGKWRHRERSTVRLEENAAEAVSAMLQERLQEDLVDFDNHLDDLEKDYLNVKLNMAIDQFV